MRKVSREILVEKQSHVLCGRSHTLPISSECEASQNVLTLELREIGKHLLIAHSGSEIVEHIVNRNS